MEEYLEMQHRRNLPTSMADVQSRYQAIPYGWREIDIAAVAARLIVEQKVTIKYAGNTIQPNNPKLPDMLRKKSEIGRTSISKRQVVSITKMKEVKEFLREYFDVMDVPDDEDGLIAFIIDRFQQQKAHYVELNARYEGGKKYPDRVLVQKAIALKVIRVCRGDAYWADKHFRKEGLEMLIDGLPYQGVKSVTIISGKDNLTASAKADCFSLQTELAQRQIVLSWRVIESSAFKWHDRWLVADNQCHNIPPVLAIIRGQRSEILSTEEQLDVQPFIAESKQVS